MRRKYFVYPCMLTVTMLMTSCATIHYKDDGLPKNFSGLNSGKKYKINLNNNESHKMVYSKLTSDSIIGYSLKDETLRVAIAKSDVKSIKDIRKAGVNSIGVGIGLAGITGLIITSSRTTKN